VIKRFRSKALRRFWTNSDASGLRSEWIRKVERLLAALESARTPHEMDFQGSGFHPLRGEMKGRYALTVSRDWRLTYAWDGEDAVDVDLEDYHG
jgi:proteic killer suppression protein